MATSRAILKINFILPFFSPRPIGGLRVAYEYANHLSSRGHLVSVIHPRSIGQAATRHSLYGAAKAAVGNIRNAVSPPKTVSWQKVDERVRIMDVPSPDPKYIPEADAVFATTWQTAEWVAQYPGSRGTKFYIVQDFEPWIAPRNVLEKAWKLPLNKITISEWLYEQVARVNGNGNHAVNIPIGVDLDSFTLTEEIEPRSKTIAMLYSSAPSKDSANGLNAIEECKRAYPELQATFFGVTSRRRPREIPEWIDYRWNVPQRELVEIFNQSQIYVCSSIAEGFALPPAEAMACGCAVASTDCGGNREYALRDVNALLSPPGDGKALADNIRLLLGNDELRVRIAKRGHEMIQSFTWERSAARLEDFVVSTVRSAG